MTPWAVAIAHDAEKDLDRLPHGEQARMARAVERWATTGGGDLRAVANMGDATHHLRVGDWRVLLALDSTTHAATILRVLPRGSAYKH